MSSMIATGVITGRTNYSEKAEIYIGVYMDGQIALKFRDPSSGEILFIPTCCLYPVPYKTKEYVWIKDHGENAGLGDYLVREKIITLTGETRSTGFLEVQEAKLTPWFIEQLPDTWQQYIVLNPVKFSSDEENEGE